MTSVSDEVLISIRPSFANAIFNGLKAVEIRRKIPSIKLGDRLWIYVTKPVGEVRGVARIAEIIEGDPAWVWQACGARTGLSRSEFDIYMEGSAKAYGLILREVRTGQPAPLPVLKAIRAQFHPPQVATRLTAMEARSLERHLFPT